MTGRFLVAALAATLLVGCAVGAAPITTGWQATVFKAPPPPKPAPPFVVARSMPGSLLRAEIEEMRWANRFSDTQGCRTIATDAEQMFCARYKAMIKEHRTRELTALERMNVKPLNK